MSTHIAGASRSGVVALLCPKLLVSGIDASRFVDRVLLLPASCLPKPGTQCYQEQMITSGSKWVIWELEKTPSLDRACAALLP